MVTRFHDFCGRKDEIRQPVPFPDAPCRARRQPFLGQWW